MHLDEINKKDVLMLDIIYVLALIYYWLVNRYWILTINDNRINTILSL